MMLKIEHTILSFELGISTNIFIKSNHFEIFNSKNFMNVEIM